MRTFRILCLAFVACAAGSSSWARLGETEEQCEKRYGKGSVPDLIGDLGSEDGAPILKEDKVMQYKKEGTTIYIGFIDGKAASIQYSFWAGRKAPLQRSEVEKLLKLNAPDREWYYHFEPSVFEEGGQANLHHDGGILWSTDGEYCAYFTRGMPELTIRQTGLCPVFRFGKTSSTSLGSF